MSNIDEDHRQRGMQSRLMSVIEGVCVDVSRLHAGWIELWFDRELRDTHSVVENWQPESTSGVIRYRLWAVLGLLAVVAAYPVYVLGLATRYYARRLDRWSASLGLVGVVLVSVVVWGALTTVTYLAPIAFEGLVAVAVASVVATVSAALGLVATRRGGRFTTVAFGYPFGVTALFLPPVVASLYSPTLAAVVFPHSTTLAIFLLDTVLQVGGLADVIRASFELEGIAYVGMWFVLAVPIGWMLGGIVSLVDIVRPSTELEDELIG